MQDFAHLEEDLIMRFASMMLLPLALGACSDNAADPRRLDREETLLQVSASARAEAQPDEARFTAGVQTIAATAAAASSGNNQVINRILASLDGLGVKKEDVQTRNVALGRIEYGANKGRFEANNIIEIRVRNPERAGEAIAAATDAGANVLSGPNLSVGDPEAATRSAYAAAYKSARARADAYAGAAGLKVVRVLTIRDGSTAGHYGPRPEEGFAADATAEVAPPPIVRTAGPMIRAGTSREQVQVSVDFALAPA
jgi:hypothetical protein